MAVHKQVSSVGPRLALRQRETDETDEGPMLETLDCTIRIGSTPTFLYFETCIYMC